MQRNKWKKEEQEALVAGVAKYGTGKWMHIIQDPHFASQLQSRSNIDLKDKWRNIKITKEKQKFKTEELK